MSTRQLTLALAWLVAHWKPALAVVVLTVSILGAPLAAALLVNNEKDRRATQAEQAKATLALQKERRVAFARSSLLNCQQIEFVKTALRDTIEANIAAMPRATYYKHRPGELVQAQRTARLSLERFAPTDCYTLPAVVVAGLKRPSTGGT